MKVLYQLRLNSLFGPLLTIFTHMGKIILQYSLLLLLLTFTFGFTGRVLFSVPQFSSLYESQVTLFSWMLGQFHFEDMSKEEWVG